MLQGKWKTQVLYEFCINERMRFGELKKDLPGITNAMLTNTLWDLEKDGPIVREQLNEIPPRVEYSFSDMGRDLLPFFYSIMIWAINTKKTSLITISVKHKMMENLPKRIDLSNNRAASGTNPDNF